jgi:hypothetical protein
MRRSGVREMLEVAGRKGMQDGEREESGAGDFEKTYVRSHPATLGRARGARNWRTRVSEITYLPAAAAPRKMALVR